MTETVEEGALAEEARKAERSRGKSVALWANGVAATASVAAMAGALLSLFTDRIDVDPLGSKAALATRSELDSRIVRSIGTLQNELIVLRKEQETLTNLPADSRAVGQIAALDARLDAVSGRLERLEQAIQITPEKALAMPLMRRDIENLKESNAQSIGAVKASVDQIYDLTKWLLGALAVGVLSLAISNYFQRKRD